MRLFYAAFLSQENGIAYQDLIDRVMRDAPSTLRPIPPGSHHLTLAFLGEIHEGDIESCRAGLTDGAMLEAFSITLEPPRILMGRGRPRLICADVGVGCEQVSEVQQALLVSLSRSLPSLEIRPKPPHVTLARFNRKARRSQAASVREALARHFDTSLAWKDRLAEIHLVRSTLTATGPIYETVQEAPLFTPH